MNILSRRMSIMRKSYMYPRFFLHMLYGEGNFQFYEASSTQAGLIKFNKAKFSTSAPVNRLSCYYWKDDEEKEMDPQISKFTHKSNAQELIAAVPVIEVDGDVARCTGINEYGYGHPVEYIALNTRDRSKPNVCKW